MEHTNAAIRFVKKRKFFYMSTNALMHEPNKELYVLMFVVIAKQYF
jgi:hypothetical protein